MTSSEAKDLCRLVAVNKGLDTSIVRMNDSEIWRDEMVNVLDDSGEIVASFTEYREGRAWLDPEEPRWSAPTVAS